LSATFKAFSIQIENPMLLSIYRHDDETNARLVEGIRPKIKKKVITYNSAHFTPSRCGVTLLQSGRIDVLCYSTNWLNKRMPMQ
jgi:hypothetical protein